MITFYDKACMVVRLFKWQKTIVELVLVKPNYSIPKHTHPNIEIEICPLFGLATFVRHKWNGRMAVANIMPWSLGQHFTVPQDCPHWFWTSKWFPLAFINIEKWSIQPSSATQNFKLI